jgi:hypothetical protein
MADVTGDAFLPPSTQDLHTTTLKSPKKREKIASAVGHGATDASAPASKSRYPSCRHAGIITTNVGGVLLPILSPRMLMLTLSSLPIWLRLLPRSVCKYYTISE